MSRPLDGILVVSIDQAVAAPFAASRLADAGARVIKVERPGGDFARAYDSAAQGESAYFVWLNRGKESVVLDIKDPADSALLQRMIARADVFIQNLAPGAAARAGFGSDALRARHPRLITCDISGYGEDGPYAGMKAYDLLVQAESGLAGITGGPEAPGRVGVSVCDIGAGLYALAGILEALFERTRTGRGKGVQVSLFDAMADWMTVPLIHQELAGKAPERLGLHHPVLAPYGAYETGSGGAQGGMVVIAIQNHREWESFCDQVLGLPELANRPEFADPESRVRNRRLLDAEIDAVFGARPRDQVIALLERANIAYGAVNSVEDLGRHPQLRRARQETPAGPLDLVASPIRLGGEGSGREEEPAFGPVPSLGAHTEAIRAEFAAAPDQDRKDAAGETMNEETA